MYLIIKEKSLIIKARNMQLTTKAIVFFLRVATVDTPHD